MFYNKRKFKGKGSDSKKNKLTPKLEKNDITNNSDKWRQTAILKEKENQLLLNKLEQKEILINENLKALNQKIDDNLQVLKNYDQNYLNKYHNKELINKLVGSSDLKDVSKILDLLSSFSLNTLYYQEKTKDISINNLSFLQSYELKEIINQTNKTNEINTFLFKFLTLTQLLHSSLYLNNNPQFYLHVADLNKIKSKKSINLKYLSSFNEKNPIFHKLELLKKDGNSVTYKNTKQFEVILNDEVINQFIYKAFMIYYAINKEVEKIWSIYNETIEHGKFNNDLFNKLDEYINILTEDSDLIIDNLYFIKLTQNYQNYLDFNRLSNSHYFHNN